MQLAKLALPEKSEAISQGKPQVVLANSHK